MEKILILANHIDWIYSLRKELIERLSKHYKVIICSPKCENLFKDIGVEFVHFEFSSRGLNILQDAVLFKNYYKTIKRLDPCAVLTYTVKPNVYGSIAARLLNKKSIINITGLGSGFGNSKILSAVISCLYKIGCSCCYHAFFQNKYNMELFIDKRMVKKDKASLIPGSGVNLERFSFMKKTKDDSIIRFLFIARIMKEKGIEEYLNVADRVTGKHSNVEFQILGPIQEERYRKTLEYNKNKRIVYLGKSNDVRNEIKEVDCIVHPTFYNEGMSNVLLEGAAMYKPLIASDMPGCREVIEDGSTGYLFEPKNVDSLESAILKFIGLSKCERENMGRLSRIKIEAQFDRNIIVKEYIRILEKSFKSEFKRKNKIVR